MSVSEQQVGFDGFVAPHLRSMWLLATRLAGPGAREDVVQEALLTAWKGFGSYDPARGTPRTWLLVITADKCRKHWRSARSTVELVDVAVPAPDVAAHLDVTRAVARLPRRQRVAVELYYVLGLPVAEVAEIMGCAVGTVSSTLSDARKALRVALEET